MTLYVELRRGLNLTSWHAMHSSSSAFKSHFSSDAAHWPTFIPLPVCLCGCASPSLFLSSSLICLIIRAIAELADCHFQLLCHWCIPFPLSGLSLDMMKHSLQWHLTRKIWINSNPALLFHQTEAYFIEISIFKKSKPREGQNYIVALGELVFRSGDPRTGSYCCFL